MSAFESSWASVARVDGHAINVLNPEDAISAVRSRLRARLGFTFATLNLDHLVKLRENARVSRGLCARHLRFGRWRAHRGFGADPGSAHPPRHRRRSSAFRFAGWRRRRAFRSPCSVRPKQSLSRAAKTLRAAAPGLEIAFIASPAFGFDPRSQDADAWGEKIAASGARLCFVCLGAPKQEVFADRMAQNHGGIGFVGVGAAADFLSGAADSRAEAGPLDRHGMGVAPRQPAAPPVRALRPMRRAARRPVAAPQIWL